MKLKAYSDRIFIKLLEIDRSSQSLLLMDITKQRMIKRYGVGEIISIGPLVKDIKIGDKVLYNPNAVTPIPEHPLIDKCYKNCMISNAEDLRGTLIEKEGNDNG